MLNQLKRKLKERYFNNKELTIQDYKGSQKNLILSGSTANIITSLTAGSFFIGYLNYLGASPQYCAVIGAIPQLGSILQMFSPYIFERLKHRKLLICISCFLFRFSISTVIVVPYLITDKIPRLTAIMIIYTFGFLAAGFVTPGLSNWNLSVAPEVKRGRFLAMKDVVAMFSVALVSILIGRMLDHYTMDNKSMIGFSIMFGVSLVISILDFILLSNIDEPKMEQKLVKYTLMQIILEPLKDKSFRKIILFLSLWYFAVQFSVTFIPIYMLNSLGLSFSYISAVTVISNILGMVSIFLGGYLADKTSWSHLLKVSGGIIALCYLGWSMVTPGNAMILVLIVQVLLTCSNGAFSMAAINLQYKLSPSIGKTAYLGVTSAIAYAISFLGALFGSAISNRVQEVKITIIAISLENIQILFFITGIILVIALFVLKHTKLYSGGN